MIRPFSVIFQIAVAATAVNAQLGLANFVKNAFGGAIAQNPLGAVVPDALVAKNSREITYENWRSSINVTVDPGANVEDAQEWLFYFTTPAVNATGQRNITYWDGVYNDTVYSISTSNPASKLHFGKIDCSTAAGTELCHTFFLTAPYKIPVFYHIATYINNGSTEIRRVPMYRNVTESNQQPAFLAKFHSNKEWKTVEPWTGIFNPIDGQLKDYTVYLGQALKYYEMMPQWAFIIGISFLGRTFTSRMTSRISTPPRPIATGATAST